MSNIENNIKDLWVHQKEIVLRGLESNCFGIFADPGCGKTAATINILRHIYTRHHRILSTLILCPPIVRWNWLEEFKMFSKISESEIVILEGSANERYKTFQDRVILNKELTPKIIITNYESLLMEKVYGVLELYGPKILICDESHKLKSIEAKRTKQAIKLSDRADYRYILSGTPILNSTLDIFSQFRILDQGEAFGDNFYKFRAKYFIDKNAFMNRQNYFPNFQPNPKMKGPMAAKIAKKSLTIRKESCLTLPPLVIKKIYIDLSYEQQKHYDQLKKDFITFLDDKVCTAQLAIVKALRLQQLISGHLPFSEGGSDERIYRFPKTPRIQAFKDLAKEICSAGHKIIVWSAFIQNYEDLRDACTEIGIGFTEAHGQISAKRKDEALDKFRTDPHCQVLIGNAAAIGIGTNLQEASYSIFYSRNFSLEQFEQARARNYRAGSERHASVTQIEFIAKDTIDELVAKALDQKQAIGREMLREKL